MTEPNFRPLLHDPAAAQVVAMFDVDAEWLLTRPGDYQTGAAETMTADGANWQRVVLLEWPARRNRTTEQVTVRLMISPYDALGLAEILTHTATWMLAQGSSS